MKRGREGAAGAEEEEEEWSSEVLPVEASHEKGEERGRDWPRSCCYTCKVPVNTDLEEDEDEQDIVECAGCHFRWHRVHHIPVSAIGGCSSFFGSHFASWVRCRRMMSLMGGSVGGVL